MPTKVLVVEDNSFDIKLLRLAFDNTDWGPDLTVVTDGEQAVDFLRGGAQPDFVVLDLNLPRRDGAEVLQVIRTTEAIANTPVAVLSSSPRDVIQQKLTQAGVTANCHLTKPSGLDEFLGLGPILQRCYEKNRRPRASGDDTER